MADLKKLSEIARQIRYNILEMTTRAGSGHATSSLSAVELCCALFFEKLRYDISDPENPANDRIIFSKGHASPLFYALWAAAGAIPVSDLKTFRKFGSSLEGHPTPRFKFAEAATGSLGQGLSIGAGMALAAKLDKLPYITYVLLGDSEIAEGSVWEACEIASYYKLNNLVAILDVNRLGQSGPTMLEWDLDKYKSRLEAFGWQAVEVNGHDFSEILKAFESVGKSGEPLAIVARTVKGKGVSFLENKEGWHGKPLSEQDLAKALEELGDVDKELKGEIDKPKSVGNLHRARGDQNSKIALSRVSSPRYEVPTYKIGDMVATRKAYGDAVTALGQVNERIVCLDGEVKNSTYAEIFRDRIPDRYFEMFIAEQNMAGVALGMARRGKIPFTSTFAAFWTRAFDQIRMSAISAGNIKFIGSHAGVSIGEDGPSQMGLEDLALFSSVFGSRVLCPADAVSCAKLVGKMVTEEGIFYLRTTRGATPVIYKDNEDFEIGGSKVVRSKDKDKLTIVACGMTLFEAIRAADELAKEGIGIRVIDAYSIKPIDRKGLEKAVSETNNTVISVEDHYPEGGLGDAVLNVFAQDGKIRIYKMAVTKQPMSGKPAELLDYEGISSSGIISKVREVLK